MAPLPTPAGVTLARRYYAMFGLTSALSLLALLAAPAIAPMAAALGTLGTVFIVYARLVGRDAWGQAYTAAAQQALARGRFDDVEALHAKVPAHSLRRGTVARTVAVQKALVALFRGSRSSPEGAIAAVERATLPGVGIFSAQVERSQIAGAHAVRALAYAMLGETARARADADAAESYEEALPEALARARLARAIGISREGDMVALGAELAKNGSLLLEHTMPRERALVRALRKMAHGRGRSVYREPSKPTDGGNEPGALAAWIAQVAPEAAAYASEDLARAETSQEAVAPVASPDAMNAIAQARRHAASSVPVARRWMMPVAVAGISVALLGMWQLTSVTAPLSPVTAAADPTFRVAFDASSLAVAMTALLAAAALMVLQVVRLRRVNLALIGARRAAALGDHGAADALLARAKKTPLAVYAAAAGVTVAQLAERRGDFALCARECDGAIARLAATRSARVSTEQLMPPLLALRGVALAAMGRHAEAEAELASLFARHAGYTHLPLADFRIRLVNAVRSGDLERARELAAQRTAELPVPLRDDLLADLVMATGPRGVSKEESERIDAELRENGEVSAWIDAIAPGLRGRLGEGVVRMRVAGSGSEGEGERLDVGRSTAPDIGEVGEITSDAAAEKRVVTNG